MWEFSLNIKSENFELARFIFNSVKKTSQDMEGIVTSHEEGGIISILIAVNEKNKEDMQFVLAELITEGICCFFKAKFLDKNLFVPVQDKISVVAFKQALLNFDKETDKFMVRRKIDLHKSLYIESFYMFKLCQLKAKWTELVSLANENRDYLISSEAFLDLLKFLVDNLEICEDEVNVFEEEEGYRIYINKGDQYNNELLSEEDLVGSIIDLAPQKINFYCKAINQATSLLECIFAERISIKRNNIAQKH